MDQQQVSVLLKKYKAGTLSPDEKARLESWYISEAGKQKVQLSEAELEDVSKLIRARLPLKYHQPVQRRLWLRYAAAASIALAVIIGGYFYYQPQIFNRDSLIVNVNDVPPGQNKATLILANGQKITLDQAGNGELAKEAGVTITKTTNGELVYTVQASTIDPASIQHNTMLTGNGEQYQIILPDGSHVWLNAASSITYPTRFVGNDRTVQLKGEAYFEIAHNAAKPFRVQTSNQVVEVLGTHFNINSYTDEPTVKTTLLEGSVRVSSRESTAVKILKPGQQSVLSGQQLTVNEANLAEAMAWKEGFFRFYDEDIESIMRKLSRWYNIDIVYDGAITTEMYYGRISKYKNISEVLRMLEKAEGVRFKIEGRRVTVRK